MKVDVTYADDFPLTGWHRAIFDHGVKRMFADGCIDVNRLDDLKDLVRKEIQRNGLHGLDDDCRLRSYLYQMHGDPFHLIPREIMDELPGQAGLYLGVSISQAGPIRNTKKPGICQHRWFVATAVIAAAIVGSSIHGILTADVNVPNVKSEMLSLKMVKQLPSAARQESDLANKAIHEE